MAFFRRRGSSWQVQVNRKGQARQSRTFDTKVDAEAWARQIENEMDRGVFVLRKEAENTTLCEALDRYSREVIPEKKGARQELMRIQRWKRSPLAKRFIASIQGKDIAAYRDDRLKEASANTVRHELSILSHLYTIATKEWSIAGLVNPVRQIRMPKMPAGRERRLLPEEEKALLEACESYGGDLPHLVRFAVETGMRRSELVGMTWNMVDLRKRTVTLPETKNGEKRVVPLSAEALRILSGLTRRLDRRIWEMTKPDSVTQAFIRALARARKNYERECEEKKEKPDPSFLVDLTFHDLRHEATSRFFEKGLNPMQVATITGHKTLQMLKRYTHLKAEDLAEMLK